MTPTNSGRGAKGLVTEPIRTRATILIALALGLTVVSRAASAAPQTIVSGDEAARAVVVTGAKMEKGELSGTLVNRSPRPIRDVELLVNHVWLWQNERHPGEDNPGRSDYYTVHREIPPNGSVTFTYRPTPPLPQRADGRFDTSVQIVGLVEVGE